MPFEIIEEDDGARITTRYFGCLTTSDLMQSSKQRLTDPEKIQKYRVLISDFTDVTDIELDDLDVSVLAPLYIKASACNPDVIAVAIASKDLLFGLGRMWEAHVDGADRFKWKERVVRTHEEAQKFIAGHLGLTQK